MLRCDWLLRSTFVSPAPLPSQGTVTRVVSAGAGLYVMDREVGLCLAYQPSLRRELRVGDSVQVSPAP